MAYLWTQKAWRHNGAVIKLHSLLFLPVLHFSPSEGYPLKKTFAIHFQSSPKKQELFYWGTAKNLGHYVGCAMLDWSLETELFSPFFSFLNPTSSGKEPAPNIIRWIFKRTKAPVQFFTLPVGRGKKKKAWNKQKLHECVRIHISPLSLIFQFNWFQKIISMIISHFLPFAYLSSYVPKNGRDLGVCGSKLKLRTLGAELSVQASHI